MSLEAGEMLTIAYPFTIGKYRERDYDGEACVTTWTPGCRFEDSCDSCYAIADGMGEQVITVVSIHKPGNYPTRVFYTRQWKDPAGKVFGKGALHIKALSAFTHLTRGYRHPFELRRIA